MPICKKCNCKFPVNVKIDGKNRNLCNRIFCLSCSPFGRHNTVDITKTKSNPDPKSLPVEKICSRCKQTFPIADFYRCRKDNTCSQCRYCNFSQVVARQRQLKQECIDYKGGKCEICGYNECMAALEFHHKDPKEKDSIVSKKIGRWKFDKIKSELDKCMLLCANCHREQHWEFHNKKEMKWTSWSRKPFDWTGC